YPFSGAAGGQAVLHGRLASCENSPITNAPVTVKWSIPSTTLTGTEQWTSFEGDIHVTMPGIGNSYTVNFQFLLGPTRLKSVTRRLLVTKRPAAFPTISYIPQYPRLSWYRRAIEWASGATTAEADGTTMSRLVHNAYSYGQIHWKYDEIGRHPNGLS